VRTLPATAAEAAPDAAAREPLLAGYVAPPDVAPRAPAPPAAPTLIAG
jgi:hypothetical protein